VRAAVVGHVEWVEFARVDTVPAPGQIVHASEVWANPAGGGPVAAVQLAKLGGACTFFTALGDDELGHRARRELVALGLRVEAVYRAVAQRRAFTFIDRNGERTITVIGERLGPRGAEPLPWEELADADAVYFTAGDEEALRAARRARVLMATPRAMEVMARAGVVLDVLVGSARDPAERYRAGDIEPPPRLVVQTNGREGGTYETADGRSGSWKAAPLPGPLVDTYGAGDSFAAGLTFGLGAGYELDDALELAARCGAACLAGRGPYEGQLRLAPEPVPERGE
jgi:ribokinase